MPRHKMRHCYSINFLSKWAKPDPLKPFPYSLRTVLITQLEAGPVLSAALSGHGRGASPKRDLIAYVFPTGECRDSHPRARRTCKFRWWPRALLSPRGHHVEGKAQLLPLSLWPGTSGNRLLQAFPPSQPAAEKGFRKAGSLHGSAIDSLLPCGIVQHLWEGGQSWMRPWWQGKVGTSSTGLTTSRNVMGNYILKDV